MRRTIYYIVLIITALTAISCEDRPQGTPLATVRVTATFEGSPFPENATVTMTSQNHNISYRQTLRGGIADFSVPIGLYNVSAFYSESHEGDITVYNGTASVEVRTTENRTVALELIESMSRQLVIKELYVGGCQRDDGSGVYQNDKYVILYNNGATDYDASNICFAFTSPMNSNVTSRYYRGGTLTYLAENWIPAMYSIWWFDTEVIIPPYSQIVVAVYGAVDHTVTYSRSVDLSKAEYYAMYDPESGFIDEIYYPAPSAAIPSSHYLKTVVFGAGTAWPLSVSSPGFFILEMSDIESFVQTASNYDYTDSNQRPNVKIPNDIVVDAVEVFRTDYATNNKRFPVTMDAGSVMHRNQQGYTLYRNVNQVATEAIPENAGLIVYDYSGGTLGIESAGSTDPSGIDAEASIANGAKIIYMDSNNSTNDFHLRREASLRYNK